jgi:hypothetical protein
MIVPTSQLTSSDWISWITMGTLLKLKTQFLYSYQWLRTEGSEWALFNEGNWKDKKKSLC